MKSFDRQWEKVHQERQWGIYPSEDVIRFVLKNFKNENRRNTKFLDMGSGVGSIAWFLAREGFDVTAFDGSDTAVKMSKLRMEEEALEARIDVMDASNLSYPNDVFDCVIDCGMITANKKNDITSILQEVFRVLKPGGKFFSTKLFNIGMSGYGTGEKIEENTFRNLTEGNLANIGTVHFFSKDEIISLWKKSGFSDLKIDREFRTNNSEKDNVDFFMVESLK